MIWRPAAYIAAALALCACLWGGWQAWTAAELRADLSRAQADLETALSANRSLTRRLDEMGRAAARHDQELARVETERAEYARILREIEEMRDETPVPPAVAAALERLRARAAGRDAGGGARPSGPR